MTILSMAGKQDNKGKRGMLFNVFGINKNYTEDISLEESFDLAEISLNGPIDAKLLIKLKSPYPLTTRIKLVKQLCEVVTKYTFSNVIEVWVSIRDLLHQDMPQEARNVAFQFMISCIQGQYNELGFLRGIFYDTIKNHDILEDFGIRFKALRMLSRDGRDISSFEKNISKLLSGWINQNIHEMNDKKGSLSYGAPKSINNNPSLSAISEIETEFSKLSKLQSIISLLTNILKFNFVQFEEHDISRLVGDIANVCNHPSADLTDIEYCLSFCDVLVRYGYVPNSSLNIYIEILCNIMNIESVSQKTWHIMRNLLLSHCAFSGIRILCSNLENSENAGFLKLLRGSVLFLGYSLWGKEEVDTFSQSYITILSAMRKATTYNLEELDCEILNQICELITKYEKNISFLEWEILLEILDNTKHHVLERAAPANETYIMLATSDQIIDGEKSALVISAFSKLIFQIQTLYLAGSFEGPISRFMLLIQNIRDFVSENTILMLLDYYNTEHLLYPSSPDWLVMLPYITSSFYNNSKIAFTVRSRALSLVVEVYQATKDFYQDQVIEAAIIPMFSTLPQETDIDLSTSAMRFLIEVLKEVSDRWFILLLQILLKCVSSCKCFSHLGQRHTHLSDCKSLSATIGLIDVFQHTLFGINSSTQIIEVYTQLMNILADFSTPITSRLMILQLMLRMRVDHNHRVYFVENLGNVNGAHVFHRDNFFLGDEDKSGFEKIPMASNVSSVNEKVQAKPSGQRRLAKKSSIKDLASVILDRKAASPQDLQVSQTGSDRKDSNKSTTSSHNRNKSLDEELAAILPPLWQIPEDIRFRITASRPTPYVVSFQHKSQLEEVQVRATLHDNDTSELGSTTFDYQKSDPILLSIPMYLNVLIDILSNENNWEVYSYILCHLPLQLSDKHLFCGANSEILELRQTLCDRILNSRLAESVLHPSDIKKVDIYVVAYQTLTVLISYCNIFKKTERDELVLAFHLGLQKWPLAAKSCIHALNVCCYELPLSMTKWLADTLAKLSQIITTATISVHILEFLCSLARLPDLYVNFTEADFKRVFGIAMQYIQYSKALSAAPINSLGSATGNTFTSSSSQVGGSSNRQSINALVQYERIMAYHVIYVWFTSIRLPERRKYVPYIIRNLLLANEGSQQVDEQTETCFDMLARYSYANCDPKPENSFINEVLLERGKDKVMSRTWVQGNEFLTMRTFKSLGWAEIIIRRPSGTIGLLCKLENRSKFDDKDFVTLPAMLMAHYDPDSQDIIKISNTDDSMNEKGSLINNLVTDEKDTIHLTTMDKEDSLSINSKMTGLSSEESVSLDAIDEKSFVFSEQKRHILDEILVDPVTSSEKLVYRKDDPHVDPSFLFLQLSPYPDIISKDGPKPLPDDDSTRRALDVLDRTAVVDFHKVGILYVAKNQTKESEILANIHGSPEYIKFLNNLGELFRLKNNKDIYTGGLDTQMDLDGEYAYYWKDDIIQVIFHCATLMPTNLKTDPQCNGKKRHIGNDFVRIVYNDSGQEYAFDTVPAQFNFINIVISPHSDLSRSLQFSQNREPVNNSDHNIFFKVVMQCRKDMPETGPITEFKMISLAALPAFVRNIALHSNIFAQVFLQSGDSRGLEYVSNWRERLKQIKRLKERVLASNTPPGPFSSIGTTPNSNTASSIPNMSGSGMTSVTSVPTSLGTSAFAPGEKQSNNKNEEQNQTQSSMLRFESLIDFTRYT
ncbi:hypothetical protein G9A89_021603 [Geosiphon pyriformis]|nr:hypothetical protein G9A89_021603 [Geosiphon pyriformis]